MALNLQSTVNRNVPTLGFVGFYRGPYWGVMEMQANYLGKLWMGDEHAVETLANDQELELTVSLRTDPRRAQFQQGDYIFSMETLREACQMPRMEPDDPGARTGVVLPSRYLFADVADEQKKRAKLAYDSANNMIHEALTQGRYVKRGIFHGLQGTWKLERDLKSAIDTFPSGKFIGKANFHPRSPTAENVDEEYLYVEEGTFRAENGTTFEATRR